MRVGTLNLDGSLTWREAHVVYIFTKGLDLAVLQLKERDLESPGVKLANRSPSVSETVYAVSFLLACSGFFLGIFQLEDIKHILGPP